jgi:hypothetical protein
LKDLPASPFALGSDNQGLTLFFDHNLLKRFQILFDVCPFKTMARLIQTTIQFFPQYQGQKAAKYMAPDRFIPLMKNGPGFQH